MAAIVCGGSRGIGAEICRALAANGYSVAVLSRSEAATARTVQTLQSVNSNRHCGVSCDIRNPEDVTDTFASIVPELVQNLVADDPRPLVLVNAAGISIDSLLVRTR